VLGNLEVEMRAKFELTRAKMAATVRESQVTDSAESASPQDQSRPATRSGRWEMI